MHSLKNNFVKLLRWSERHTKTDMVYLAKNGGWLAFGQFFSTSLSFLLSIAFANLISAESLGQYRFVLAGVGIIGAFSLTGLGTSITQAVARGFEGSLTFGSRISIRWSFIAVILALGTAGYYFLNQNLSIAFSFLIVAISFPIITATSFYAAFLSGKKQFSALALFSIARQTLLVAAMITTIQITQNPLIMIAVYFLTETMGLGILFLVTKKKFVKNKDVDPQIISYGAHLSFMDIFKVIASHIDRILIFSFVGAPSLAIYTIALAPVSQLKNIDQIIADLAFPKFSEKPFVELQQTLSKKVVLLSVVMGCVALVYILLAPRLFEIIFPQYLESVIYSQVFAVSLLATPTILFTKALAAHKKTKSLYIIKSGMPIIRIISLLALVPFFGIWGALFSYISIPLLSSFVIAYLFKKEGASDASLG